MSKLVNRAKMTTATTGTGTITLGSASTGYRTFAAAGVINGDVVRYVIEENGAWEIGNGTYTATGTLLARSLLASSTGSLLSLGGNAVVYVTATAENFNAKGPVGGGSDAVFYENDQIVTTSYTIPANKNAMSTGPVTINSGVTVTVSSGARYVVI